MTLIKNENDRTIKKGKYQIDITSKGLFCRATLRSGDYVPRRKKIVPLSLTFENQEKAITFFNKKITQYLKIQSNV